MKLKLLSLAVLAGTLSVQGQDITLGSTNYNYKEIVEEYFHGVKDFRNSVDKDIIGTPYLNEEFQPGSIEFPEKKPIPMNFRYNVADEEMQVFFKEGDYGILRAYDAVVRIGEVPYLRLRYQGSKGKISWGYFEVLTSDFKTKDLLLLKKNIKEVKEGKPAKAMIRATPSEYVEDVVFFLKFKGSNQVVEVDKKTRKFLEAFPEEHQEKIKDYMKENDLKTKELKDLEAVVDYYNTAF